MAWLSRLLGARSAKEMTGLVLEEPAWEIVGLADPTAAFGALLKLVAPGACLFLEGGRHPEELTKPTCQPVVRPQDR